MHGSPVCSLCKWQSEIEEMQAVVVVWVQCFGGGWTWNLLNYIVAVVTYMQEKMVIGESELIFFTFSFSIYS